MARRSHGGRSRRAAARGWTVRDYVVYGLPPPPDGCAWVWVDDDVALVDLDDGYIFDIAHNLW